MTREGAKLNRKRLRLPDPFVRTGNRILDLLSVHRNRFLVVVGVAVAVVIGVFLYEEYSKSRLEKAWAAYHTATTQGGEARTQALKKVADDWSSTRAGYVAAVNVADQAFNDSRTAIFKKEAGDKATRSATTAIEWYERAAKFSDLSAMERQLLSVDKGAALELLNKFDEAIAEYQRSVELASEGKPVVLLSLGRVFESKKQPDQAKAVYERIVKEFDATEYARLAKSSLRQMQGHLLQTP